MKKFYKPIIFILLSIVLIMGFFRVFKFKTNDGIYQMMKFYEEKDNTIDVLFLGSSHMFVNANTSVLWDEYGIASYDLGGSIQPFWNTYYYLKEAYKTQSPKVVVMDVFTANEYSYDYGAYENVIKNIYGMRASKNKKEAIDASVIEDDRECYYYEYPTFHKRYTDLTRKDFIYDYKNDYVQHNCFKGQSLFYAESPTEGPNDEDVYDNDVGEISDKNDKYLRMIIDLAKEHGSEIVLTVNPYYVLPYQTPVYNRIEEIAKECGAYYINFNHYYEEIGTDFEKDYGDACHMTYDGSAKFSRFLASWLKAGFDVPDRRGQKDYESYDKMTAVYKRYTKAKDMEKSQSIEDAVRNIDTDDYVIVVTAVGNYKESEDYDVLRKNLLKLGIELDEANGSTAWIIDNGNIAFSSVNRQYFEYRTSVSDYDTIRVASYEKNEDGSSNNMIIPKVTVGREQYLDFSDGIGILLYDKSLELVSAENCISTKKGEE